MLWRLDVSRHKHSLSSRFFYPALGFLGILVFAQVGDQHIGAFTRVGNRDSTANATIRSGNHSLQARKPP